MFRLALLLTLLSTLAQADVTGPARVIDGDTIEVAGERVRLHLTGSTRPARRPDFGGAGGGGGRS